MNCTFYRPENINTLEFDNIIGKMSYDFHLLSTEETDEWAVYLYIYRLCQLAKNVGHNPKMKFLGLAEPEGMPSDARVDYLYRPTYIATAFIMKSILLYPSLLDEETFLDSDLDFSVELVKSTLSDLMFGCTGREFDGAGVFKMTDCFKLFEAAGISEFMTKYFNICPAFFEMYSEKKSLIEKGWFPRSEQWDHIK